MDPLLDSREILNDKNWLYFKLYKDPASDIDWQNNLNWYHQTLITVVRPIVSANQMVNVVFFGVYGQDHYDDEDEDYEKQIEIETTNFVFIRLRLHVNPANKEQLKKEILKVIQENRNLIWDFEVMNSFHVMNDLGSRFGNNENNQTAMYVRFWDAGCRYILSILEMPGNWKKDVDIWGIPHLINNSLGAWLRQERGPRVCPQCGEHMYMNTTPIPFQFSAPINEIPLPSFAFICPKCRYCLAASSNI